MENLARIYVRHGLYSASLSSWRIQRKEGFLNSETSPKRGRKPKSAEAQELEKLQRENEKLKLQLKHADAIITAQKKLCEIYSQCPENGEDK
jgi:transposase